MSHKIFTLAKRPDLAAPVRRLSGSASTGSEEFMNHDEVWGRHFPALYTTFADFQLALCDETETLVGLGNTIPLLWDGTVDGLPAGVDGALERAISDRARERRPTTLSALFAFVPPAHQGKGLSGLILRGMMAVAADHGLNALIAPVRPTLKGRYPLTPMEQYIHWKQADGSPFDPWLRTHWRLGAEILRIAPRSMVIEGSVAEWEEWTRMRFPESGAYVVPGALQPVVIDREKDQGRYEDPNVWMRHPLPLTAAMPEPRPHA